MPTFAQTIDLVDDPALIAEYVAHHRAVWPEVLRALRGIGIRQMRIWRHGSRLFMLVEAEEGFDARRYQTYAQEPRAREWDALMRRYQRRVHSGPDGAPRAASATSPSPASDSWWSEMQEVFDLQEQLGRADGAR